MLIHSTAVINKNAVIGDNVRIGPYTIIGPETIIKSGTVIHGQSVFEYAEIGNNCEIFNFTSIGKKPQDLKYNEEKTKVIIGNGTIIREFVTLNRGTLAKGTTVIGKNCLIMACAHVAHDCSIGDNVIVGYATGIAGHVKVENNVVLSSNIGVHQFCKIGEMSIVGAGSMISMDIIPYVMVQGDRATVIGLNTIGLKRSKISNFEIQNIKNAYKILFMSKLTLKDAISKLEKSMSCYVINIINFVKNSSRGITRPKKR
ncbi:MAG: acyl-ACP--UDP-N-acetylglucosamine O-acyltransferase [Endomicrobium sp.]|jgi:UDP-N-acetylglucosamine acyltransferase|nr:acyl-ACP--UDP-N-acetylglucosamine O-acyltransferase [Endomicrobium sp.]